GVELGHVDGRCSFESIILKHGLEGDAALMRLAAIVHAADIAKDLDKVPEGAGLKAIAHGFSLMLGKDDAKKIELETPLYDALYAWCGVRWRRPHPRGRDMTQDETGSSLSGAVAEAVPHAVGMTPPESVPVPLAEFCLYFLRLGTFGFGGPIALVGYMQ